MAKTGKHLFSWQSARPEKRCLVIRYGGFGDMLQTASVFPALKKQGWHVTVNTTPRGYEICKHDPHVDAWLVQDKNQVPNVQLEDYWVALGREYDRVINLSESIEGSLLALPGRRNHALPHAARHRMMDINYLEWLHLIAEVPFEPAARFYATKGETIKARKLIEKCTRPLVVWALTGSSIHKAWPWFDRAIYELINRGLAVATLGGPECQILEEGIMQTLLLNSFGVSYEDSNEMSEGEMLRRINTYPHYHNSLFPLSGKIGIRESLTLATIADVVAGPETGILNAVGMDPAVAKVVMLSHSSQENLTKHWVNETALEPTVDCFPCHRMHYNADYCPRDEATGAAICASSIPSMAAVSAILDAVRSQTRKAG